MMPRLFDYAYILGTIGFTVYGQLILKWRMQDVGPLPNGLYLKLRFLVGLLFDPLIFSGFIAAFLASLAWMVVLTKFDLSHAYPFMALNFVIVLVLSAWFFGEPLPLHKMTGAALIVIGIVVATRG